MPVSRRQYNGSMTDPTPCAAPTSRPSDVAGAADVAGVPDAMLRSALELAVAVAAEGQKLRTPLAIPAGLKPFFKVNRLDAAGLRTVRRVVAADGGFRDRLGLVDVTDLVDEVGTVWLRRPNGWEDTIKGLVVAAQQLAADESAAAALRKSEKRREAAEAVAARATAELIGHYDATMREVSRRDKAEEAAAAATRRAVAVRDENIGLQRENDRLRAQLADAATRADRAEVATAAITEQLGEVERVRDDLLSRRHEHAESVATSAHPPTTAAVQPDPASAAAAELADARRRTDAAASALRSAAQATRELAAVLGAAGAALTDSADDIAAATHQTPPSRASAMAHLGDVRPIRQRPNRRQPIPIPGGLYGDSAAAAEHLLRVPDMCVVVDGYNVAKQAWPQLDLIGQRECCIAMLEDMTRRIGTEFRVVFDGADVVGASSRRRLVRVQFSPPGVSADDVIRSDVRSIPIHVPIVVVTNDQAIVSDVRAAGVNVISTDTLLAVAGRSSTP